ncbi:hypothetical protein [Cyclobacterium salsum]|uniref:hypothetical protein n=1 Tax=Cyclobacterium salsum TaxID=2666329 RepID=UPI001390F85D|nr:hypothetical protein [Cyclobacterium salsum]
MKSKWLFLPDVFLVLLVCLTCERHEIPHSGERSHSPLANEPVQHSGENRTMLQEHEKQKSLRKFIQAANKSSGNLIRQYIKE